MGKLSNQSAANGWTHERVFTFDDFSVANAGTLADGVVLTFSHAVAAGSQVRNVGIFLNTAFNDSGGGDQMDCIVGVQGGDVDGFITQASAILHADETEITYIANTGALLDNENGHVFAADGAIDITFDTDLATGTPYSLNELTAGKITIKFDIAQI